jgi:hypothetical protein
LIEGAITGARDGQQSGNPFNASMKAQKRKKNNKQTQIVLSLMTGKREGKVLIRTGFYY